MTRLVFWLIAVAFVVWLALALLVGRSGGEPTPTASDPEPTVPPPASDTAKDDTIRQLEGQVHREHRRYLAARRRQVQLKRVLLRRSSTVEAINLSCTVYGSCSTLWRRARCESRLYPYARNSSGAAGLYQFLPGTWRSTPFHWFSVFSPYANALAAGWMISVANRGGEWSCR